MNIFRGKVTLIVNIASEVHDDKVQYEGLMKLRKKYHEYGLRIVALPSRQFAEIPKATAMQLMNYLDTQHVEFDMFMEKVISSGQKNCLGFLYENWFLVQLRQF